jgi:hypothetical protein
MGIRFTKSFYGDAANQEFKVAFDGVDKFKMSWIVDGTVLEEKEVPKTMSFNQHDQAFYRIARKLLSVVTTSIFG